MPPNMFCAYEHIRPDTNKVFYVGKGSLRRAHSRHRRNQYWKNIVSKVSEFSVNLLAVDVDEELAFLVESERIDQLKRLGFKLANMTDGGEGPSGMKHSAEAKKKISEAFKGNKHPAFGKPMLEHTKLALLKANLGRPLSEEHKKKVGLAGIGRIVTNETRANMSKAKSGRRHHMANAIMFDGKFFGSAKELSDYTGVSYAAIRSRLHKNPTKYEYVKLGYTKDFKGVKDE